MKQRYVTENFFKVKLSQQCLPIATSGDPLEEFTIYLEQVPTNSVGWVILDFADTTKRDLIYYHSTTPTTITYYRKDRSNPTVRHARNSYAQINDVAQLFNYLFDNVDDLGLVQDMGTNKAKILGGKCYYNKAFKTIADTSATALADGTWYAVLDYSDDTLKFVASVDTDTQLKMATVVVAATDISSITDDRNLQLQSNKNVVDGLSDTGGNLLYNGVPLGGGAGTGDVIGPSSSTADNIVTMQTTTGKVIKDSGKSFSTSGTLAENSDDKIATQKAVKTYADTQIAAAVVTSQGLGIVSLTAGEDITIGDNLCYKNTEAAEQQVSTATDGGLERGRVPANAANIAQKITMSATGYYQRINTVKFDLKKEGSPTDNITVSIYNDDFVTVIDTSDALDGSTLDGTLTQKTFTFSGSQNLIPGKSYYLVIRRSGAEDNTNYYWISYKTTTGSSEMYRFNGTDWALTSATEKTKYEVNITTYAIDPTTVMKMDANDPLKIQDAGIATETITSGNTIKVQMSGVVAGLTGLTPNLYYYASDTAGALSTTPSTTYNIRIGKAISATQLLIDKKKIANYLRNRAGADQKYNGAAVQYAAVFTNKYIRVYTGFRPTKITLICGTSGGGIISNGFSDGVSNYLNYIVDNNPTTEIGFLTSECIRVAFTTTVTNILSGTLVILDNGFEVKYTKSSAGVTFTGAGYMRCSIE